MKTNFLTQGIISLIVYSGNGGVCNRAVGIYPRQSKDLLKG